MRESILLNKDTMPEKRRRILWAECKFLSLFGNPNVEIARQAA